MTLKICPNCHKGCLVANEYCPICKTKLPELNDTYIKTKNIIESNAKDKNERIIPEKRAPRPYVLKLNPWRKHAVFALLGIGVIIGLIIQFAAVVGAGNNGFGVIFGNGDDLAIHKLNEMQNTLIPSMIAHNSATSSGDIKKVISTALFHRDYIDKNLPELKRLANNASPQKKAVIMEYAAGLEDQRTMLDLVAQAYDKFDSGQNKEGLALLYKAGPYLTSGNMHMHNFASLAKTSDDQAATFDNTRSSPEKGGSILLIIASPSIISIVNQTASNYMEINPLTRISVQKSSNSTLVDLKAVDHGIVDIAIIDHEPTLVEQDLYPNVYLIPIALKNCHATIFTNGKPEGAILAFINYFNNNRNSMRRLTTPTIPTIRPTVIPTNAP